MKHILLFGAGKSATILIQYLVREARIQDWHLTLVDQDIESARKKAGHQDRVNIQSFDIRNKPLREATISKTDLVISLLPPSLHILIAQTCIVFKKNLLTPSYLSPEVSALKREIEEAGLLFMGEMGLDPGIDHMSAMKAITRIKEEGGASITGFESYCGALVAPESDDNPWHYKISWSPKSLIKAGKQGATFRKNNEIQTIPYQALFGSYQWVNIPHLGQMAYIPNRDSAHYANLYQLENTPSMLRATLRHPAFCKGWQTIVKLGLTNTDQTIDTRHLSYREWLLTAIERTGSEEEKNDIFEKGSLLNRQFSFLDLLEDKKIDQGEKYPGEILLELLTQKLLLHPQDKDMVVMLHRITYTQDTISKRHNSLLITKGKNNQETALAKTVGLPLGILAKFILQHKINLTGLHIPILPEIYLLVLQELEKEGIHFEEYSG